MVSGGKKKIHDDFKMMSHQQIMKQNKTQKHQII